MQDNLYYKDNYLMEFKTKVVNCIKEGEIYKIVLENTAFYPEGGGQKADIGLINNINVIDVQEKDGIIYHTVNNKIEVGTEVSCKVDFESRFSNMQHHTAEHIVSGIVCKKYHADNVGFHMGKDAVTMDFNVVLNKSQIEEIERLANEAVFKNIPINTKNYLKEEAQKIEYRSKKDIDGIIRIVEIPGYDICACCGIHVARTGEIGVIKLLSVEKYKSGSRVSMVCGKNALNNYNEIYNQIDKISAMLSAKHSEIVNNVNELLDKNLSLKRQYSVLRNQMFEYEISGKSIEKNQFLIKDNLDPNEIKILCTKLQAKTLDITGVLSKDNNMYRFQIMSKESDLRPIANELTTKYNGKGGGNSNFIQGQLIITDEQANDIVDMFMK